MESVYRAKISIAKCAAAQMPV